jgi:signal peptidase I
MKKLIIRLSIFFGSLIMLWFIAQATGILKQYTINSGSMEPTFSVRSRCFISNLKKPSRYDIIAFRRTVTADDGIGTPGDTYTFLFRLVGFGGEVLELRNGYVWINGKPVDDSSRLKQLYLVRKEDAIALSNVFDLDENDFGRINDSMVVLNLKADEYKTAKKNYVVTPHTTVRDPMQPGGLYGDKNQIWTSSNYGPVKIPADHYFVLGDNRSYANDSRFIGPIPIENMVGAVLGKK